MSDNFEGCRTSEVVDFKGFNVGPYGGGGRVARRGTWESDLVVLIEVEKDIQESKCLEGRKRDPLKSRQQSENWNWVAVLSPFVGTNCQYVN